MSFASGLAVCAVVHSALRYHCVTACLVSYASGYVALTFVGGAHVAVRDCQFLGRNLHFGRRQRCRYRCSYERPWFALMTVVVREGAAKVASACYAKTSVIAGLEVGSGEGSACGSDPTSGCECSRRALMRAGMHHCTNLHMRTAFGLRAPASEPYARGAVVSA
eukprot:6191671-Pleurochrysis_carterae.AAC.2